MGKQYKTHKEATAAAIDILVNKDLCPRDAVRLSDGTVIKLDSVAAWNGTSEHKMDGSKARAIYLSYEEPTQLQIDQAGNARLAGVSLEEINGRIIDVKETLSCKHGANLAKKACSSGCSEGCTLILFGTGLRDGGGKIPFRSINIDRGLLLAMALDAPLDVTVEQALASAPQEEIEKLKLAKKNRNKSRNDVTLPTPVPDKTPETPVKEAKEILGGKVKVRKGGGKKHDPEETPPVDREELRRIVREEIMLALAHVIEELQSKNK
jgi:hypothetical protein